MEVDRKDTARARCCNQIGDKLGCNQSPGGHLSILPGVTIIRDYGGDPVRGSPFHGIIMISNSMQLLLTGGQVDCMELLIMMDAMKRASEDRTAVIPYYGYARQDAKVAPGPRLQPSLSPI